MEPITLRLPAELLEQLSQEAEDQGYSSRSEYIRHTLRSRNDTGPNTRITDVTQPATDVACPNTDDVQQLEQRVSELEQRVNHLEEPDPRDTTPTLETDTEDSHTDLLEYVREHGPVKAGELKDNCYPRDCELARSTWWTKRAKERLKESNAHYTNNIGWRMPD